MKIPPELRWKGKGTVGSGAQARVERVTDSTGEFQGDFALKGLAKDKPHKAYQRFAREIDAIKKVDHPNVIKIVDHSKPEDDFQYYVMEYIAGAETLKKLVDSKRNPFYRDPVASLNLFWQLSSAIEAWRGVRIVHRDLSPANILVTPDHSIKVIDFGICQVEEGETITLTDEGVGSRNYTAPECEAGADGTPAIMADFYSAGKVLWTAITNEYAFAREAPVFKLKSMSAMFPKDPHIWHLQHIFEQTIRHRAGDRISNGDFACQFTNRVKRQVTSGFMPLLRLQSEVTCPICGWGTLQKSPDAPGAMGAAIVNYGKQTIEYGRCNYCGTFLAIDTAVMEGQLKKMGELS